MNKLLKISAMCVAGALMTSCHHHHDHGAEGHSHDAEMSQNTQTEAHSANGVAFSLEMQQGVDFAVSQAEMRSLGNVIRTVAQVLPAQGDEIVLSAKVDGVVTGLSSQWNEGTEVKAGQMLCMIDASASATDNLNVQQTQAVSELERAKSEFARVDELHKDKLVLESEWLQARATLQQAEAAYKALHNGYDAGRQKVAAPQSGYLVSLAVANGQHVAEGEPIAVLSQGRKLQLKAEVSTRYYKDLKHVSGAVISSTGSDSETWTLEELQGRLLSYGRQVSSARPLIPLTFEVMPNESMVVGSFVDIFIQTDATQEKLCVPHTAILEEMGNYFVYVQEHDDFFEKRQVRIGSSNGLYTEILSGLQSGEKVVSRGAVLLKLQQSAGTVDAHAGHSH